MVTWHFRFARLVAILGALLLAGCTGSSIGDIPANTSQISGIVTKSRGEPIANATVRVMWPIREEAITDDQGRFNIETDQPRLGHDVRVEAEGYLPLDWIVSTSSPHHLRLVSLDDFSDPLFRELTGASETAGTWRLQSGSIYVDRSGPWRPEFDLAMRNAYNQWAMLARGTGFGETPFVDSWNIHLSYVHEAPCGVVEAIGCTGILSVSPAGVIESAFIELHADYGADVGLFVHEMGHTMGLINHSQNPNDIMYTTMNGMTTPSNQEAAIVSVLYYNPPGTTMGFLRFPPLLQLAPEASAPAAVPSEVSVSTATVLRAPSFVATSLPPHPDVISGPQSGFQAVADIVAMVRNWFGGNGCFLNLPLFCNFGTAVRIW